MSRACHEETLVIWRIEGFSSDDPPPPPSTAPTTYDQSRTTRSAFAPIISPSCPSQYTRLLTLATPGCGPQFFMRFSLFHSYGQHPVLAFCNAKSNIFFWDFARFSSYKEYTDALTDPDRDQSIPIPRPSWLAPIAHRKKSVAAANQKAPVPDEKESKRPGAKWDADTVAALSTLYSAETIASWRSKYNMASPHDSIKPHRTEQFGNASFVGRQVTWSPEGDYCVVVGSRNLAVILQRWAKNKIQKPPKETEDDTEMIDA